MRSYTHVLAVFAVLLTMAGRCASGQVIPRSVLPGLAPGSTRVIVDIGELPWRGVVLVQTEVGSHCSGALVGPLLVLTAAHCLLGRGTDRLVRPGSVHVLAGYQRGAYAGHARAARFETGAGFAAGTRQRASPSADWAVLTLDTVLGTPDRVLPVARGTPSPGTAAMLGGYEQDRAQVAIADVACAVLGLARNEDGRGLLHHSCAGTRGVSGAPLLTYVPGAGWSVAGIATLAESGRPGGYAVPVGEVPAGALARTEEAR